MTSDAINDFAGEFKILTDEQANKLRGYPNENWSALAYLTSNEISKTKDIAVGIIVCYQGESVIETWVPEGSFQKIGINIPEEDKLEKYINYNEEYEC